MSVDVHLTKFGSYLNQRRHKNVLCVRMAYNCTYTLYLYLGLQYVNVAKYEILNEIGRQALHHLNISKASGIQQQFRTVSFQVLMKGLRLFSFSSDVAPRTPSPSPKVMCTIFCFSQIHPFQTIGK